MTTQPGTSREQALAKIRERAAAESPDDPSVKDLAALLTQIRLDQAQPHDGQAKP